MFVAKISDFGISRVLNMDTHVTTNIYATYGYLCPKYTETGAQNNCYLTLSTAATLCSFFCFFQDRFPQKQTFFPMVWFSLSFWLVFLQFLEWMWEDCPSIYQLILWRKWRRKRKQHRSSWIRTLSPHSLNLLQESCFRLHWGASKMNRGEDHLQVKLWKLFHFLTPTWMTKLSSFELL